MMCLVYALPCLDLTEGDGGDAGGSGVTGGLVGGTGTSSQKGLVAAGCWGRGVAGERGRERKGKRERGREKEKKRENGEERGGGSPATGAGAGR
ncbi:hypothetical protein TIFTF001_029795 [Ficus carica]|uniref:Uncharacterized protein n=1 Tax=Ficus carica TaxID=3494 RepID=A0AA88J2W6_FICCA|nr:hypothetical protein TIFTF001_029795 [Ficus carica]